MSILLIDEPPPSLGSLKPVLERATGWRVSQTSTVAQSLEMMLSARQRVEIVVFTVNQETIDRERAFRFLGTVNDLSAAGRIARPFLLALSLTNQPPEFAAKLEKSGVQLLLRKYPEQITEVVKRLQWQTRSTNGLPTIIVERVAGQIMGTRIQYRGAAERLGVGPRLSALAAYLVAHSKRELSTTVVADALGISRASVKEYLLRLRLAFDRIRRKVGTAFRGKDVFWTKRMPGGHVHGLNANTAIEDSEEFFFAEEERDSAFTLLRCHVCHRHNPRSQTAWSHVGWICAGCCEDLQKVGEM